jgi:phosphoesterase RecJ-like protein
MTNPASIAALLQLLRERNSFLITSHVRPDGDAIGSSLGLMHLLQSLGKSASVVFTDPIPPTFHFLPGVDRIQSLAPAEPCDATIFLECDSVGRSSLGEDLFQASPSMLTINIDHHRSGRPFADFNWIDPEAPAVGAMIYDIAIAAGVPITAAMADCLYAAILTDTGSFNYPSTSAATFAIAEHLVQCGTNPNLVARQIYFSNPASKVRLLGVALSNLQIDMPVSWSSVSLNEMERAGASVEDCEGVANHLIGIAGMEAAVFMRELPGHNQFRLSLRSRGTLDVASIAEHFGGGGHHSASGCSISGSLEEVTHQIVTHLRSACKGLPSSHTVSAPTLLA